MNPGLDLKMGTQRDGTGFGILDRPAYDPRPLVAHLELYHQSFAAMIFIRLNSCNIDSITAIYCAYSSPVSIVICLLFSFSAIANDNCRLFNNSLHYGLINDPLHLPRHASTGTLSNLSVNGKRNPVPQVKSIWWEGISCL